METFTANDVRSPSCKAVNDCTDVLAAIHAGLVRAKIGEACGYEEAVSCIRCRKWFVLRVVLKWTAYAAGEQ